MGALSLAAEVVVIADPGLLRARAAQLSLDVEIDPYIADSIPTASSQNRLRVAPIELCHPVASGVLARENSHYVLATLDRALQGCMRNEFDALVTGPVQKSIINDAGIAFTGHTEYLGLQAGNRQPVMMLITGNLRVALVTTHLALRDVAAQIDAARVAYTIRTVVSNLKTWFGIERPRVAVCGLNPHAGENGHLGSEEETAIRPAIDACRREGLDVTGPLPADTVFRAQSRANYDAIISMYHDQGLPVLKALGFGHAVNVTLGLPFIRTSVDHGTALELAGSGRADPSSLVTALNLALTLVTQVRAKVITP